MFINIILFILGYILIYNMFSKNYKFLIIVSFITLFYVLDGISTKKNRLLYLFLFSIIFHLFSILYISSILKNNAK